MSKKTFSITMAIVFVAALSLLVFGACAVKQAEQEVAEVDEYLSEATESTRTSETTTTEETTTETTTTVSETTEEPTTASVEELAEIIVTMGINGDERRAYLGEDYEEVQSYISEHYTVPETYYEVYEEEEYYYPSGDVLTPEMGVHDFYGITETYYNLPMDGVVEWMHSLGYGGEYWVRGDGVKMLGDYVMVAADYGWMPKGSIVETSLGTGIVCDTGLGGWYWYDIATNW